MRTQTRSLKNCNLAIDWLDMRKRNTHVKNDTGLQVVQGAFAALLAASAQLQAVPQQAVPQQVVPQQVVPESVVTWLASALQGPPPQASGPSA